MLALTTLFNKSIKSGEVPTAWKHAHVQRIFKQGEHSSPANFRSISLTSVRGKVLDHVIRSAITSHLNQSSILVDVQHGFRKRRSIETRLILTIDDLATELDKEGQTRTILLDFTKAFNKVPQLRLPLKLHHYDIRGQKFRWISSFLTDRT